MTQNNNNPVTRSNDLEQLDFIDLVMQLWRGKLIIGAFVAVFIILAGIYISVVEEKWTSSAIISQPDAAQIATYSNALNILYGGAAPSMLDIQTRVIGRFNSSFSALSQALENQEIPEKLTIEQAVKGQSLPLSVSYTGESAEAAQKQLAQYIQQVDEQTAKELALDLKDNIKQQITTLNDSLENQEKVSQEQKDLRIKQITEALKNAEAAKITSPQIQQTQDVTQETMFLLGSEALKSMIENEASRPLVFSGAYYQTKQNLLDIEKLNVNPDTIHVYRYVMKPDLPVYRDSPKKAITLILAVLLGGIIGSGVVLGRNALRNYKPKS
ncbi:LPS O-antigen chain length determinant protein WzzB [Enterobacter ludwigii]|jgi:chain length determinant protein (polysaccharide antigen chain regulator)|uniref:LPS O-antigen chain length determinant protein WzzB n=1 Tax=Enterobacter ludwigii TaxID=299767 RepID=UPI0010CD31FD|nr:LPS O-antigen chain length determinant protein WzzB [Enterobacter ludwigii]MCL6720084.1 LPS O-antigen chain length determinant protein WzzB [Klebsiella sp. T2.Ur]MDK9949660.1 LPS O-antigen chain length determinant protein WzzB [Enterobacter ludwigii]MED5699216.1 LPS O-antigen chain length determinant protein WzzB [Enterobacter ludwigii]QCR93723.1 LPS O-antigen chain length determinant protein WzzB [Enterobacter ludwigii]QCU06605.1 LPS O-antigen chain length determinant protein WzzB [Enterob